MSKLFTATVRKNGRIVIPKKVREEEEIGEGDSVVCHVGKVRGEVG